MTQSLRMSDLLWPRLRVCARALFCERIRWHQTNTGMAYVTRFSPLSACVCVQSSVALTARYPQMQLACVRSRNWLRRRLMDQPIYVAYINATTRAFCAEGLHFSAFHFSWYCTYSSPWTVIPPLVVKQNPCKCRVLCQFPRQNDTCPLGIVLHVFITLQ